MVALGLYANYWLTGRMFGEVEMWLWPSAIMLMALQAEGDLFGSIIVVLLSIAINAILYGVVGLVVLGVGRFLLRFTRIGAV